MADTPTHGLAGALLAQTGFQQRYGPAATVALVVGTELPDLALQERLPDNATCAINGSLLLEGQTGPWSHLCLMV